MNAGVLADVERVQVQPEGADHEQQRIDECFREAKAAVRGQTAAHHGEVFKEIARGTIGRQPRQRGLQHFRIGVEFACRALDAGPHTGQVTAVSFELKARAKGLGVGVQLRLESLQPCLQFVAHRQLLRRGGQQIDGLLQPLIVVIEQPRARRQDRLPRHVRRDERIAVAIPADPRAEGQQQRQLGKLEVEAVLALQRSRDFLIQTRQRLKKGDVVIIEAHADFIGHRRLAAAHFIGLPQRGDLRGQRLFERGQLLIGNRNAVELLEELAHAAALHQHRAAGDFGGMRGEHGDDEDAAEPRQRVVRADTGLAHGAQCSTQLAALGLAFR